MPNPVPPAGPCTPGTTLLYGGTCNASGEAYGSPDWFDPTEIEGPFEVPESVVEGRVVPRKKCGGCRGQQAVRLAVPAAPAADPVACFDAGVRALKEGLLAGLDLQKRAGTFVAQTGDAAEAGGKTS